jgi:hypothetical protein
VPDFQSELWDILGHIRIVEDTFMDADSRRDILGWDMAVVGAGAEDGGGDGLGEGGNISLTV